MKKLILLSFLSISLFSCSDDDGGGTAPTDYNDYFPVSANATWNYDYSYENQGQASNGQIAVTIDGTTNIEGNNYQVLDNTFYLIGAMNQVYFNKATNQEVTIRPTFDLSGTLVDLGDLLLIKNDVSPGTVVDENSTEVVGETMQIPANSYDITGTVTPRTIITVRNEHVAKQAQMIVNGQSYNDINEQEVEYEINVFLDIDASLQVAGTTLPLQRSHELVSNQEYGELDLWMAKDIGIVKTSYDYSFEDLELTTIISLGGIEIDLLELAPELSGFNNQLDIDGEAEITDYAL